LGGGQGEELNADTGAKDASQVGGKKEIAKQSAEKFLLGGGADH